VVGHGSLPGPAGVARPNGHGPAAPMRAFAVRW
jgi:hypothetical protein